MHLRHRQPANPKKFAAVEDDIVFSILIQLPAKSALRFRTVSKSWKDIITNPKFTRHHHAIALRRSPATFLASFPIDPTRTVFSHCVTLRWIRIDRLKDLVPRIDANAYDRSWIRKFSYAPLIVGDACGGVFCIAGGTVAALWNPATREVKVVEFTLGGVVVGLDLNRARYIGFGSVKDAKHNVVDFKLLFVQGDPFGSFWVYSLRAGSWTSVCYPSFAISYILENGGVYLNGVIHWLSQGGKAEDTAYILTFDLVSETFGKIGLPRTDGMDLEDGTKNFLSVLDNQYLQFGMVDPEVEGLNLWVLYENEGKILWVRREEVGPLMMTGIMLRYFDCIGGVINQADLTGKFWFHIKDKATQHDIGLHGHSKWYGYAESLVSLKGIANQ